MTAKVKAKVNKRIAAKARQVLEFAESKAKEVPDWLELHFALFGVGGKASDLFPTEAERSAFLRTAEYKRINALMNTLPHPKTDEMKELVSSANGAISVRLPRSVHAALLAEAKAEGVSLNQLCVAKLIAQLRAVV
jgi:HicB family